MVFSNGDILDYADTEVALRVKVFSYEEIKINGEYHERVVMEVERIYKDDNKTYEVGHKFVRERPIGALEEEVGWSLTRTE